MNASCYKTVFSKRLGALVAVGEHASRQGQANGASGAAGLGVGSNGRGSLARFVGALAASCAWVALAWAQPASNALPTGGQVAQGAASISQAGAVMNIHQSTPKAVLNWNSFDIGSGAKVNIIQPGADAVMLNRINSANPSQILGQLSANGQVVLVNPSGIVFGKDGSVSASSFTASTLGISDANFMAGNMRFERNGSTAGVVNQGAIKATGGYVALLGASVSNEGKIETQGGAAYLGVAETIRVPLGSSGRIKLELSPSAINAAVSNSKGGAIVTQGGQVYMQAYALQDAVASIVQSGSIDTSGEKGGAVHVLADGGRIRVDGSIKANSNDGTAGGDIYIGRDKDTNVLAAVGDASGATLESKGGFVETSGKFLKTHGVSVKAAEWLLDPVNITIAASAASGTAYGDNDTNTAGTQYAPTTTSTILASDIAANLNAGTHVRVFTGLVGSAGSDEGNITVSAPIVKSGANNAKLTLEANNRVIVNARIGRASGDTTSAGNLDVDIVARGNALTSASGSVVLSNVIDARQGVVNIEATSQTAGWEALIFSGTSGITAGTYTINATALNTAIRFNGGTASFSSSLADSQIVGSGGGIAGVFAASGNTIHLTTSGTATTTVASGANSAAGMRFGFSGGVTINTSGNVTIGSHNNNAGLFIQSMVNVNSGLLTLRGRSSANGIGLQDGGGTPSVISVNNGASLAMHGISTGSGDGISLQPQGVANAISMTGMNAGSRGTISLVGQSATGAGVRTNLTSVTSDGGNIALTGTSQGTALFLDGTLRSGNASGGGEVSINGTSTGTVTPLLGINVGASRIQGGTVVLNGSSASGAQGVYTGTASQIESVTGAVSLSGSSATGLGVQLQGTLTGKNGVTITATNGSNTRNVSVENLVKASSGDVTVTSTSSSTDTAQRAIAITGASAKIEATAGNVNLVTDTLLISGNSAGVSGAGTVTIRNVSAGTRLDLGGSDAVSAGVKTLGLDQGELNLISADQLVVGDAGSSGNMTLSASLSTRSQVGNIRLRTSGDLVVAGNFTAGDSAVRNLSLEAGGAVVRTAGRLAASDLVVSAGGTVGSSSSRLQTAAATLSLNSGGDQYVTEADHLRVAARTTANNGRIDIETTNGTLQVETVNAVVGASAHGGGSIRLVGNTSSGVGLNILQNVATQGDVVLEGRTSSASNYEAGVKSSAAVSGRHISMTAQALNSTDSAIVLGYYGAGGSFLATESLNLAGDSLNAGNALYSFGGLFRSGTGMTLTGTSRLGQGLGFDKEGPTGLVVRLENTGLGNMLLAGSTQAGAQAIGLNGVTISNNGGHIDLTASSGDIIASLNPIWGGAPNNVNTITSGAASGAIRVVAGGNASSSSRIDASLLSVTQNSASGVQFKTQGMGHLTVPKITNNGAGDVVLAAGALLTAGDGSGGQVLTVAGNALSQSAGAKIYVYSGAPSATGALSVMASSFGTLYYQGNSQTLNAAFNRSYGDTITGGADAQVLFRQSLTQFPAFELDLSGITLAKTYGQSDPHVPTALQAAYTGPATLTRTVSGVGGNHTFSLAASDAIAALAGSRAAGSDASLTPYAYNLTSVLHTVLTGQPELRIDRANLTAALSRPLSKQYDGNTVLTGLIPADFSLSGWVGADGANVLQTVASYASPNVSANTGSGLVSAVLEPSHFSPTGSTRLSNYNLPTSASGSVGTITPAPLTIKVNDTAMFVTQDPATATNHGFSFQGLQNGEDPAAVLGPMTRVYTGVANPNAGQYANVYGLSTTPNPANYSVTVQPGNLTVAPADKLLITINSHQATYGGITASNAGASAGTPLAQYCLDSTNCTGTNIVNLTMTDLGNGSWKATDPNNAYITFRTAVDAGSNVSSGGYLNAGNYSYGLGAFDTGTTVNFRGTALSAGVLAIRPKPLTLVAANVTKVYDGTSSLSGVLLTPSGALAGDDVAVSSASGGFTARTVGSHSFSLSGMQLQGADRANYAFAANSVTGAGTITPRPLSLSASVADKVYDGTTSASLLGLMASGWVDGESVSANGGLAQFSDRHVLRDGAGNVLAKPVLVHGVTLSGADAGNYQLSAAGVQTQAKILPRRLTVSGTTVADKVEDGTLAASVTLGALSGWVGQEQLRVNAFGLFRDSAVGTAKPVDVVYNLADGTNGARSDNYELPAEVLRASIVPSVRISPVQPILVPSKSSAGSKIAMVNAQPAVASLADEEPSEPGCSVLNTEKCDCQETQLELVHYCVVPNGRAVQAEWGMNAK